MRGIWFFGDIFVSGARCPAIFREKHPETTKPVAKGNGF